jgi:hypothetical protein
MITVKKPFNSRVRRFKAGDKIEEGADLAPHNLDELKKAGFVEMPASKAKDGHKG